MISITITGNTLEEFKNKLEAVAIDFLTEKKNDEVIVATTNPENKKEVPNEKERQEGRQEEVISSATKEKSTPEATVDPIAEGVKKVKKSISTKKEPKKIVTPELSPSVQPEFLKENAQMEMSFINVEKETPIKVYTDDQIQALFKEVISKGREKAVEVLGKYGVARFGELDTSKLQDFASDCEKIVNG